MSAARPDADRDALARAAAAGAAYAGLDPVWCREVERLVARGDDGWRACCMGSCDPCVEQLGRAVDHARAQLERRAR